MTPYEEGRLAFHAPKITDCPYTLASVKWQQWWRGFRSAQVLDDMLPKNEPARKPVNLRKLARRIKALESQVAKLERIITDRTGEL